MKRLTAERCLIIWYYFGLNCWYLLCGLYHCLVPLEADAGHGGGVGVVRAGVLLVAGGRVAGEQARGGETWQYNTVRYNGWWINNIYYI